MAVQNLGKEGRAPGRVAGICGLERDISHGQAMDGHSTGGGMMAWKGRERVHLHTMLADY